MLCCFFLARVADVSLNISCYSGILHFLQCKPNDDLMKFDILADHKSCCKENVWCGRITKDENAKYQN